MGIRPLEKPDIPALIALLQDYMAETYAGEWHGSSESLSNHAFGQSASVLVMVEKADRIVGFVAWTRSYDLHWSMRGAMIVDLFVRSGSRGRGIGVQLICSASARVEADGGTFIKGGAVDSAPVRRLYERTAIGSESHEYTLSGRAFRHVASLDGASARTLVTSMPEKKWNFEE